MEINNKKILEEVAEETGFSFNVVDKSIRSIFEFIRATMKEGKLKSVRLIYFGIFVAKEKINYNINKNKQLKLK